MRKLELGLCGLLALAALGHVAGTFTGYEAGSEVFVWSLSATGFVFTVVFLHVLRLRRPGDRLVAAGAIAATIGWIGLALMFGAAVGSMFDARALTHAAVSLALLATALHGWSAHGKGSPSRVPNGKVSAQR